jgi:hypothetical protein
MFQNIFAILTIVNASWNVVTASINGTDTLNPDLIRFPFFGFFSMREVCTAPSYHDHMSRIVSLYIYTAYLYYTWVQLQCWVSLPFSTMSVATPLGPPHAARTFDEDQP